MKIGHKFLLVALFLSLLLGIILFNLAKVVKDKNLVEKGKVATETISGWQTYQSDKYKFEIKLPPTWNDYRVISGESPMHVEFHLFANPYRPYELFRIISYSKEEWNAVNNKTSFTILSNLDDKVYVCDGCCADGDQLPDGGGYGYMVDTHCKEAPNILKTFRVTK